MMHSTYNNSGFQFMYSFSNLSIWCLLPAASRLFTYGTHLRYRKKGTPSRHHELQENKIDLKLNNKSEAFNFPNARNPGFIIFLMLLLRTV
jgi:hypothetical protein